MVASLVLGVAAHDPRATVAHGGSCTSVRVPCSLATVAAVVRVCRVLDTHIALLRFQVPVPSGTISRSQNGKRFDAKFSETMKISDGG